MMNPRPRYGISVVGRKRHRSADGTVHEYVYYLCPVCHARWQTMAQAMRCAGEMRGIVTDWISIRETGDRIANEFERESYYQHVLDRLTTGLRMGAGVDPETISAVQSMIMRIREGLR